MKLMPYYFICILVVLYLNSVIMNIFIFVAFSEMKLLIIIK